MKILRIIFAVFDYLITWPIRLLLFVLWGIVVLTIGVQYGFTREDYGDIVIGAFRGAAEVNKYFIDNGFKATVEWKKSK
jgi:hypothetical protein